MFRKKLIFSFFLLLILDYSLEQYNWTIINNSITINSYETQLTDDERDDYYYWIGLRNSFYYSKDTDQLEKLVKYFTPEEDDYYSDLFHFSAPGFIAAGAVIIIFIAYLIKRFLLKGCKGPKIIVKSYHTSTFIYIALGFLIGIIFLSLTIYNCAKSNSNIDEMMDFVEYQKNLLNNIHKEALDNRKQLKDKVGNKIDTSIYGEKLIEENHKILIEKMDNFDKDLYKIQKHKFRFQIASLVLFIVISIIGVCGYWLRKSFIPWTASMILLLLAAPVFAMSGLETTYTFLSIDFCSSIGNSIISGIIPSDNKGLGKYLACPSKEAIRSINTAIYDYIFNFDYLYNETVYILKNKNNSLEYYSLGEDKRNNDHFIELIDDLNSIKNVNNSNIIENVVNNLESFILMNEIIAALLSMTSCYTSKNSINYIEEKYCAKNHPYMFRNVIFDMISALGFIIISIGLNKLMITMKSHYAKALRGKKEFNSDIINDDEN